ncbi:hypothetical protein [Microcoleus sp. F4-D5]|uniref:hypothetical protein n=1 Tax=Microcoleus sp. F4-D5 TaxID=2818760 RepID=UPI002FCF16C3
MREVLCGFAVGPIERAIDFWLVGSGCPSECGGAIDGRVKTEELSGCVDSYYQERSRSFY